jgi:hypothetical protein
MSGQRISAIKAYIFASPLFVTGEFGIGGTSPVGHHGKERAFDGKVDVTGGELL